MEHKRISIGWSSEDVQHCAEQMDIKLTVEESIEVLELVEKYHDASIGINWEVIETHILDYVADKKAEDVSE